MIRVCDDEDTNDLNVRDELRDLNSLYHHFNPFREQDSDAASIDKAASPNKSPRTPRTTTPTAEAKGSSKNHHSLQGTPASQPSSIPTPAEQSLSNTKRRSTPPSTTNKAAEHPAEAPTRSTTIDCQICSLENPRLNATCMACAHVLDPRKDPRHWLCTSQACKQMNSAYINAGDVGMCGVCGARKG